MKKRKLTLTYFDPSLQHFFYVYVYQMVLSDPKVRVNVGVSVLWLVLTRRGPASSAIRGV